MLCESCSLYLTRRLNFVAPHQALSSDSIQRHTIGFAVLEDELTTFFNRNPDSQHLRPSVMMLVSGSWALLVEAMRQTPNPKSTDLEHCDIRYSTMRIAHLVKLKLQYRGIDSPRPKISKAGSQESI